MGQGDLSKMDTPVIDPALLPAPVRDRMVTKLAERAGTTREEVRDIALALGLIPAPFAWVEAKSTRGRRRRIEVEPS